MRDQHRHGVAAGRDVADRVDDAFLGQRVERRGRLVEHEQVGPPQQRPRDRSRCFSPPETLTPPSPITVSRPRSARASRLSHAAFCSTSRHSASDAVRVHKQQVLADRPGKELCVLRDKPDPRPEPVQIDVSPGAPL